MNTYKKSLYAYYTKQVLATIAFSVLRTLSYISGNSDNSSKMEEQYKKFMMSISKPVKISTNSQFREQVHVA